MCTEKELAKQLNYDKFTDVHMKADYRGNTVNAHYHIHSKNSNERPPNQKQWI